MALQDLPCQVNVLVREAAAARPIKTNELLELMCFFLSVLIKPPTKNCVTCFCVATCFTC